MGIYFMQKLACIFALLYLVFNPNINVIGVGDTVLEKIIPADYKVALGSNAIVLNNIWNSYSIRYARSSDDVITIIYSGPYNKGWTGIGFSHTGHMFGSSTMVGWVGNAGNTTIKQYALGGYTPSLVAANKGDLPLTKVIPACVVNKGTIYMAFQVKLNSTNLVQNVIFASSPDSPIGDVLTMHQEMSIKQIDFTKGSVDHNPGAALRLTHGALGFFAWMILSPTAVNIARHFKHKDPLWFYLHMSGQITTYVLTLITIIMGLQLQSDMRTIVTYHKYTAFALLAAATLQVLAICARPAKDSPIRKAWRYYHIIVGFVASVLGIADVLLGMRRAHEGTWSPWRIAFLVCIVFNIVQNVILSSMNGADEEVTHEHQPPVFNPAPRN